MPIPTRLAPVHIQAGDGRSGSGRDPVILPETNIDINDPSVRDPVELPEFNIDIRDPAVRDPVVLPEFHIQAGGVRVFGPIYINASSQPLIADPGQDASGSTPSESGMQLVVDEAGEVPTALIDFETRQIRLSGIGNWEAVSFPDRPSVYVEMLPPDLRHGDAWADDNVHLIGFSEQSNVMVMATPRVASASGDGSESALDGRLLVFLVREASAED